MHLVVFGLSVSSSWGNGHATHWRALGKALRRLGHRLTFFERDVPYYASHRDPEEKLGCELQLYAEWDAVETFARHVLTTADAAMVTSYCPDGPQAANLVLESRVPTRVFYDMDAPVTLERLTAGENVPYLPTHAPTSVCLADFDQVLSFTGGRILDELRSRLGARSAQVLYGCVDPEVHQPAGPTDALRAELSYMGTYAADRAAGLAELFLGAAEAMPDKRFLLVGSLYPSDLSVGSNVTHLEHLPPQAHASLYGSSRATLNLTREAMAHYGHCPSSRLFEAAACGTPLLSDVWEGIESFFRPEEEIALCAQRADVVAALGQPDVALAEMARLARERTLDEHSASVRAAQLVKLLEGASVSPPSASVATPKSNGPSRAISSSLSAQPALEA